MRRETIIFRSQDLTCSPDYAKELRDFKDCMPEKCGRFVSDSLVGHQDAVKLLDIATRGLNFGGSDGGVSILDLHSGALSKGDAFINIYTLPEAKGFLQQDLLQIYKVPSTIWKSSLQYTNSKIILLWVGDQAEDHEVN